MYAVIETGGKQYRVEKGSKIVVEKLQGEPGTEISLDKVLLISGEGVYKLGRPYLEGASVKATVTTQGRAKKILVFKRWRRNDSKKLYGHRQPETILQITAING